ncbi:MAG: hypothetical protein ACM3UP_02300, partial [Methanocella sp.]
YAGQTRPPVKEFAAANAPLTMPVFALFTGSGATPQEQDREQFDKVVTGAGGRLTATAKVTANEGGPGAVERQMATFAEVVERALKGRP